jgi:F-type H+-transporting ATPase subunit b
MSALPAVVEEQPAGHTEVAGHAEPTLLGLGAEGWVYVGVTIFFLLAIFVAKAPQKIVAALDAQIAQKRADLDEAARIRAEAQTLLEQAKAQQAQSAADAEAMLAAARTEAANLIAQAEIDTAALIERRGAMAETKIGAAERAAVEGLRRETAGVAVDAARRLVTQSHDEAVDRKLADEIIAGI